MSDQDPEQAPHPNDWGAWPDSPTPRRTRSRISGTGRSGGMGSESSRSGSSGSAASRSGGMGSRRSGSGGAAASPPPGAWPESLDAIRPNRNARPPAEEPQGGMFVESTGAPPWESWGSGGDTPSSDDATPSTGWGDEPSPGRGDGSAAGTGDGFSPAWGGVSSGEGDGSASVQAGASFGAARGLPGEAPAGMPSGGSFADAGETLLRKQQVLRSPKPRALSLSPRPVRPLGTRVLRKRQAVPLPQAERKHPAVCSPQNRRL